MGNIIICCVDEKRNFDPYPDKEPEQKLDINPHALQFQQNQSN